MEETEYTVAVVVTGTVKLPSRQGEYEAERWLRKAVVDALRAANTTENRMDHLTVEAKGHYGNTKQVKIGKVTTLENAFSGYIAPERGLLKVTVRDD